MGLSLYSEQLLNVIYNCDQQQLMGQTGLAAVHGKRSLSSALVFTNDLPINKYIDLSPRSRVREKAFRLPHEAQLFRMKLHVIHQSPCYTLYAKSHSSDTSSIGRPCRSEYNYPEKCGARADDFIKIYCLAAVYLVK